jgi:3',5'-cyclic AMP phosphodiesterase CpdA
MPRIAWLTDIHLNFVAADGIEQFYGGLAALHPDAVLLGGDIAEAHDLIRHLHRLATALPYPIYFVLGNHDFYRGSISQVRHNIAEFCAVTPNVIWLTAAGVIELAPQVGLVGHDGWADGRLGDYERSPIMLNDYLLIEELAQVDRIARWQLLKQFGDEAADHVLRVLPAALDTYPHVIFLTHVPPFREACWHQGQISNDDWLPHFTCDAVGKAISSVMRDRPDRRLTVLCGHTHSSGEAWPIANVQVLTGAAEYGHPHVQRMFEF